ncbi:MAG: hypothetical protein U1F77_16230 [Kiritimatiellia bacterium]
MSEPTLSKKKARCEEIIRSAGRVLVAYSGGVDSTLVAKLAFSSGWGQERCGGDCGLAQSGEGGSRRSRGRGAPRHRHSAPPDPQFRDRSARLPAKQPQRCCFCKSTAYDLFAEFARTEKFDCVMDGTNADDTGEHRPGRRAAREHGVRSPLRSRDPGQVRAPGRRAGPLQLGQALQRLPVLAGAVRNGSQRSS